MLREKSRTNHYIAAVIGIAVLVFLDQFTKCLAIDRLKGQSPFIIIKEVFQLEYLENRGALSSCGSIARCLWRSVFCRFGYVPYLLWRGPLETVLTESA